MKTRRGEITQLLDRLRTGDREAEGYLAGRIYADLRRLARIRMASERPDHTLTPTALVHEAWLRIEPELKDQTVENRQHFFALAATAMRRILVEHARRKKAAKRTGAQVRLHEMMDGRSLAQYEVLLALDAALDRLLAIKPRAARVVELRFFGGMSHQDIAALLKIERRTVDRDWAMARSWLSVQLSGSEPRS